MTSFWTVVVVTIAAMGLAAAVILISSARVGARGDHRLPPSDGGK
jgi:hypothetical protein